MPHLVSTDREGQHISVYTRSGDDGKTDLMGDGRVPKDAARLEVLRPPGCVELLARLVALRSASRRVASLLEQIRHRLFDVCTELVTVAGRAKSAGIAASDVRSLEQTIDCYEAKLESLNGSFFLPAAGWRPCCTSRERSVAGRNAGWFVSPGGSRGLSRPICWRIATPERSAFCVGRNGERPRRCRRHVLLRVDQQ